MDVDRRFPSNGVSINVGAASNFTSGIMLLGFILSVIFAVVFNFEMTTKTHCGVANYLPSISAAIAEPPSSCVWRLSVTLCTAQRLTATFLHYGMYSSISLNKPNYRWLCRLCLVCELMENLGLIGLTCVSSVENHKAHENFFILFQVSSMLFMMFMCMVHRIAIMHGVGPTHGEYKSFLRKLSLFITNLVAFASALYFFYRHNRYCEAGVYTIFAFLEYVVVISNILFHFIVSNDFKERELRFGSRVGSKL